MDQLDQRDLEIQDLRGRLSRLCEASLRINESLDFDTVLQGVLDSARSLTTARYGVMTLLDDAGQVQDFLSSGMTAGEAGQLWELPGGWQLFEYLGSFSAPLRLPDLLGHIRSIGLPELHPPLPVGPVVSFLAAPVFYRAERVGNIYLAEKEDGAEFTLDDEETLVMFASQAALAISNARRYRDEQRARTDLETLMNTSPVGVVVFDAKTGGPISFNREARRIVDALRDPDQLPEDLLEVLRFSRADGREVSLEELPLTRVLSTGETVRAEEIVLQVPDGRSVTVLLNATPIRSAEGMVESLVVTIQDMTPLEEMQQIRAQFMAMVSHELRMPLTSIKGSAATVLDAPSSLERAEIIQFFRIIDLQADRMHDLIGSLLDVARIETGTLAVNPEATDLLSLVDEAKRAFLSVGYRNDLRIEMPPDLPWVVVDRGRIVQVLTNLLSNGASYSPEGTPIHVAAVQEGVHIAVSVSDKGKGLSEDQLPRLFRKFYPTNSRGQGIGLNGSSGLGLVICRGIVESHGGRIWAESDGPGMGARFTFTIPIADGETGASPMNNVLDLVPSRPESREQVRILAVDDDPQTLRYVRDALSRMGYLSIVTGDPDDVPRLMQEEKPHLVLLDLMLPGSDGIELMRDILRTGDVPVIFLSVYGEEHVIARAFDMGASDYVVKPFSPTELAARIRAALRSRARTHWDVDPEPYTLGDLSIDYGERRVTLAGLQVKMTATEYEMLYRLSVSAGRVLTHDQLLHRVWGPGRAGEPWLIRNMIKRLRSKLNDDADNPTYIFTEPRVGYRMPKGESVE